MLKDYLIIQKVAAYHSKKMVCLKQNHFYLRWKPSLRLSFFGFLLGLVKLANSADFSFSCPGIGFFGDELDCRVYYICTGIGKVGSPMKCDGDLAWNQDRLACEWKRNLPADICQKKKVPPETEREKENDSDSEVEVFDPFFSTKKSPRFTTTKRFSGVATSRTSLPPPTTSRLGNLTEEDGKQLAQKLLLGLSETWLKAKLLMSFAVLTLL